VKGADKAAKAKKREPGLGKALGAERDALRKLQEDLKETAQRTESAEPVFSKALEDALRGSMQSQAADRLDVASKVADNPRIDPDKFSQWVSDVTPDVKKLAEALASAEESVFGDDAEALKRARDTVSDLRKAAEGGVARMREAEARRAGERSDSGEGSQKGEGSQRGEGSQKDVLGEGRERTGGLQAGLRSGNLWGGGDGVPAERVLTDVLRQLDRLEAGVDAPRVRREIARAQKEIETLRSEVKRQGRVQTVEQIEAGLMRPLAQVQDAVSAELARSAERRAMGPVDRDPVPRRFEEAVKRYYDALGGGR
jgi:hypothetical protein